MKAKILKNELIANPSIPINIQSQYENQIALNSLINEMQFFLLDNLKKYRIRFFIWE